MAGRGGCTRQGTGDAGETRARDQSTFFKWAYFGVGTLILVM